MTDNEGLMQQAESHGVLRRVLLIVNAGAYIAGMICTSLTRLEGLRGHLRMFVMGEFICWPVWFLSLLAILWTMQRLRQRPDIGVLVDDERTSGLTARSFQAGYWALLLGVAGLYAASFLMPVDVRLIAPLLVALGVAAPGLTYAFLYRG